MRITSPCSMIMPMSIAPHNHDHPHDHDHAHDHHDHHHDHDHSHEPAAKGSITARDCGRPCAGPEPGAHRPDRTRHPVEERCLRRANRARFARSALALNFVSSPGSGKTTLLVRAIEELKARLRSR